VVKINLKLVIASLFIFTVLMGSVYAAGSKLIFSDVDVKVGSKTSKNQNDGDTIDDEAAPGDKVEFRIETKSNFTNADNLDIEDVTVEVTIEGIDDGDDFDDESNEFNLRPGNDKRVTVEFEIPLEVEEDSYEVLIEANGEDENGIDHRVTMRLKLEVEKENHLIEITGKSLNPTDLSCNRRNVQVGLTAINLGNEDEEDIKIQVYNPELDLDLQETVDDLTAEPNEDESRFSKTFYFNVPADTEPGAYNIALRALYEDNRRKSEEFVTLNVNECGTDAQDEEDKSDQKDVEVITPPPTKKPTTGTSQTELPEDTVISEESFVKSNAFLAAIIVVMMITVIVGIALVVSLFRR